MPMQDSFDTLLTSKCSIWKKGGTGTVDGYGIESQVLSLLVQDIPCRMDYGAGKELLSDVAFGVQSFTFFMRPLTVDTPPIRLNIHHWIQLNNENGEVLINPPDPNATMYNIKNIKRLQGIGTLGMHLEVEAQLIEP